MRIICRHDLHNRQKQRCAIPVELLDARDRDVMHSRKYRLDLHEQSIDQKVLRRTKGAIPSRNSSVDAHARYRNPVQEPELADQPAEFAIRERLVMAEFEELAPTAQATQQDVSTMVPRGSPAVVDEVLAEAPKE